jgi:hypothetical protein
MYQRIIASGQILWAQIDFALSNLTDIATRNHADLQNINTASYTHLSATNHTDLTDAGNTILHYHEILHPTGSPVIPKTSGVGIKVDVATPTFGWRDILGPIGIKSIGATDPVWTAYRGSIYAYTFDTATAECFITFHIPHDYVPGSDMYIHMHWSQNVVDTGGLAGIPGNVEWNFDISYADGHGTAGGAADPFIVPITVTVVQQGSTTQYGHMIAEVQFTNNGGTGGLIDSNTIVVDGLLLVRAYRIKGNAADTLDQAPFGHTCDIHYQSTNMATKNKSPNFYS